mmetsp:Transcript_13701/g.34973  ORF Transcript_13701/g.34973 Transcript_13701/m.34973 type:complete len:312 (+) Transcript_13701:158-1093(+)
MWRLDASTRPIQMHFTTQSCTILVVTLKYATSKCCTARIWSSSRELSVSVMCSGGSSSTSSAAAADGLLDLPIPLNMREKNAIGEEGLGACTGLALDTTDWARARKSGWLALMYTSCMSTRRLIISLVGFIRSISICRHSAFTRSWRMGNLSSSFLCSPSTMRVSSRYTRSQHRRHGSRSCSICRCASSSKAASGTKTEARGPDALRMALRYASMVRPAVGSIMDSFFAKLSLITYRIRAPGLSDSVLMAPRVPSSTCTYSWQNLFTISSIIQPMSSLLSPGGSPRAVSSCLAADASCLMDCLRVGRYSFM